MAAGLGKSDCFGIAVSFRGLGIFPFLCAVKGERPEFWSKSPDRFSYFCDSKQKTKMPMSFDLSQRWAAIVNPVAGSGRGLTDWPQISGLLRDEGIAVDAMFTLHKYLAT